MPYVSGPVNIQQGNTANFVVEYFDSSGNLSIPSGGTVTIVYRNTQNVTTTDTVTLTQTGSFFTGSWSSSSAALGLATWTAAATGSTAVEVQGQIRVIDRED